MPSMATDRGRCLPTLRFSRVAPASSSRSVSSSAVAVVRATRLVTRHPNAGGIVSLSAVNSLGVKPEGALGRPEPIAGPGEVVTGCARVQPRVDATEEPTEAGADYVAEDAAPGFLQVRLGWPCHTGLVRRASSTPPVGWGLCQAANLSPRRGRQSVSLAPGVRATGCLGRWGSPNRSYIGQACGRCEWPAGRNQLTDSNPRGCA